MLYESGIGFRDLDLEEPVTPDTLFGVASLTKPFTAAAVLQLVDRTDLSLDADASEYVPLLNEVPGEPISIHELLSHSSGLPRDFVTHFDSLDDGQQLGRIEHIEGALDQRLTDRSRYMYSNSGYFLLAEVIETITERSYTEYIEEEVFAPLDMERSVFDPEVLETDCDAMTGYLRTADGLSSKSLEPGAGAAGGLISSVTELGSLLQCILNDGVLRGNRILSKDLIEKMCRLQSPALPTVDGTQRGYGYGWEIDDFLDETLVAHRGGIGISGGYMCVSREHGHGVALALNTGGQPVAPIGKGVLSIICGEDPMSAVPTLKIFEAIDEISGTYTAYRNAVMATVEKAPASTILVNLENLNIQFTMEPEDITGERYRFSRATGSGVKWLAEFDVSNSPSDLILSMGKWTYRMSNTD
ncbi:beta-lactamase [Halococcus hamelinensis 100A6]|uniref:Beta-lactamase n=2 Tax=Halococcus hamelinensis TaxID=332168 RepID=M0MBF7_9EURY|nr:beta-lactamase [Halococcus hamelinensis 100A6]